jgi:mono/diheme cytochrome c family protein
MPKSLLILPLLLLFVLTGPAQQNSTPAARKSSNYDTVPAAEANKPNPVKATAESLARGKKQYGYDCAMCHGEDGAGKGDVATSMNLKMQDFTDPATLKSRTDGELFYIIKNGKGDMPPEGDRVKAEQIWDMVNYLRTFSKGKAASEKPGADAKPPADDNSSQ